MAVKASLQSQLGFAICEAEDTEEMYWLRETDDCQSKIALGNALAAQYRFRDAIDAYAQALAIRDDDFQTCQRLAGSHLTLRHFDEAMVYYRRALELGGAEKSLSFPMGVWHYLKGEYPEARGLFEKVLPCSGELEIAVIYWHTLCSYRAGMTPALLADFRPDMNVGHHTAYLTAVKLFHGDLTYEEALSQVETETGTDGAKNPLNFVVSLYGLWGYLTHVGRTEEAEKLLQRILKQDACWPCISYLAAYGE